MSAPLSPEREAEIRARLANKNVVWFGYVTDLLSALDHARAEHAHLGQAALSLLRAQGQDHAALDTEYHIAALEREVENLRAEAKAAHERAIRMAAEVAYRKAAIYGEHAIGSAAQAAILSLLPPAPEAKTDEARNG